MKKAILRSILVLLVILLVLAVIYRQNLSRVYHTIHLFDEDVIVQNFQDIEETYNASSIAASSDKWILPTRKTYDLPESFIDKDTTWKVEDYLDFTRTEGLLVIHRDTIVLEEYSLGLEEDESHVSWSMAKSFLSAMIGIAVEERKIDIQKMVTDYIPSFAGTGYEGVKIEDLLHMSSGVKFNEDYGDFNSDINRFGRTFSWGSSLENFCKSLKNNKEPGTFNHYVSIDTQVLGHVLRKVIGRSITEYTQEKLWDPIGMEHDGQWITDNSGMEMVLGGLNATLRDYAKLGLVYLHNGKARGKQVVPESWVAESIHPKYSHLKAGNNPASTNPYGYGYQWWRPDATTPAFFAAGIYNQYVYVDMEAQVVIAKLSANHRYKQEGHKTKATHMNLLNRIAQDFYPTN